MKFIIIWGLSLLGLLIQNVKPGVNEVMAYVRSKYKTPESVRNDCHWNYAVVKIKTNQHNVITGYELLNDASKDMYGSFRFLLSYRFSDKLNLKQRPVVFCLTVDNQKFDCIPDQATRNPPSEVVASIMSVFEAQRRKQPNTIFIYDLAESIVYSDSK
ncbi:hypothetical protein GCM10027037_28710 [Mucilaginibacter koreensis]